MERIVRGVWYKYKHEYNIQPSDIWKKGDNQVIEKMLMMYVMDHPLKWGYYLHFVEFAYNNGYHSSLKMSPFNIRGDLGSKMGLIRKHTNNKFLWVVIQEPIEFQ